MKIAIVLQIPDEMSHSAPHSHPLEYEIADLPLQTQLCNETPLSNGGADHLTREVQRTISLTSENPSEMFFSAEEDISNMMSQGGSVKNRNGSIVFSGKKRFSSDLRYIKSVLFKIKKKIKILSRFF